MTLPTSRPPQAAVSTAAAIDLDLDAEADAGLSIPDIALWSDSDAGLPAASREALLTTGAGRRAPVPAPTIGHIGRYALKQPIGAGSLGTVYAAHDPLLSRQIAIKTLNLQTAPEQRAAFNTLFLDEARAAAALSHPHIVTVYDAGVSDGQAYIAMELLLGRDLRQLHDEGWRPTPKQAALIVRRVADALAYAHNKGVVHCDMKPANIFMVGRTQPRVLDFGIARLARRQNTDADDPSAGGSPQTLPPCLPHYQSPEQVRQQPLDRRSDVFSLGVVLYELLTGNKPFRGEQRSDVAREVLEHVAPPANVVKPDVPAGLAQIAAQAMAKLPEQRFRSAGAMSRELRRWLDVGEAGKPPAVASSSRRLRSTWLSGFAGLGLVSAAAAWWALDTGGADNAGPDAAPTVKAMAAVTSQAASAVVATTAAMPALAASSPAEPASGATPMDPVAPVATAAHSTPAAPASRPIELPARPAAKAPPARTAKDAIRDSRPAAAAAAAATGIVRLAISPWGHVEVDGVGAGTVPPLGELKLPEGRHQVTVRNEDFPPYSVGIDVVAGQPVTVRHKFGS